MIITHKFQLNFNFLYALLKRMMCKDRIHYKKQKLFEDQKVLFSPSLAHTIIDNMIKINTTDHLVCYYYYNKVGDTVKFILMHY